MKVFASRYLEASVKSNIPEQKDWSWNPYNEKVGELYASGNLTSSHESTYADERDNRSDQDRPNEGMLIA